VVEGDPGPTLTVTATVYGSGTLTYQWYWNTVNSNTGGTPIPGANDPSYQAPVNEVGTRYYYVIITNTDNTVTGNQTTSVTSAVAAVTVLPLFDAAVPVIEIQPAGATVTRGSSNPILTVTASVYGVGTLSYQWYRNTENSNTGGTPISGADGPSYPAPTNEVGTTYYYVIVTNTDHQATGNKTASVTSHAVAVTVYLPSGGGGDDAHTNEVQPEEPPISEPEPKPAPSFKDIAGHWAEKYILALAEKGFIQGYPDGTFRPDQPMTRAEFVTIVAQILGFEFTEGKTFADTANHWAKEVIATAYRHGIIRGYNDTSFGPDDPITREQMIAILVKAFGLGQQEEGQRDRFADEEQVSFWAKEAIEIAAQHGIIAGYEDGTFRPGKTATRAEVAAVIERVLRSMEHYSG
jgi:hypothetical protein